MAPSGQIWAFDCEWAPDLVAGRKLFHLAPDAPQDVVLQAMWRSARDYDAVSNPQPFLKTVLCRLVSIATVVRTENERLFLWTAPALFRDANGERPFVDDDVAERAILGEFLGKYEKNLLQPGATPHLVGYNSRSADLHVLCQRALVNGLQLSGFHAEVSAKPWNQASVDLMDLVGGRGNGFSCTLNEIAVLCNIPGKVGVTGDDVCGLYYGGNQRRVVEYNVFDALTTYLLWLRMEFFAGRFSEAEYAAEKEKTRAFVKAESAKPHGAYLNAYLDEWARLEAFPA